MTTSGLIPRNRLSWIPREQRLAHEYCYFLHDQAAHALAEYERAQAHLVRFTLRSTKELAQFEEASAASDSIKAMRSMGRGKEARRVVLNTITMAMVSDCLHHIFEALRCMERRKVIVAFNLLRKPLLDSLLFLAWIVADENGFYQAFTSQSPDKLSGKSLGNRRKAILSAAVSKLNLTGHLDPDWIEATLFDPDNGRGLYRLLQRAVHLVTTQREAVRTEPENFNFIFKSSSDDDSYEGLYEVLPGLLLLLSHLIAELFHRMKPMDKGSRKAFWTRSVFGYHLVEGTGDEGIASILKPLKTVLVCPACKASPTPSRHNLARILLSESFRCSGCHRVSPFPFAWFF